MHHVMTISIRFGSNINIDSYRIIALLCTLYNSTSSSDTVQTVVVLAKSDILDTLVIKFVQ